MSQVLDDLIEDRVDMLGSGSVAWYGILLLAEAVWWLNGTLLGKGEPACLSDCLLTLTPPSQLSHVGENDARGVDILSGECLGLDVLDKVDCRSLIDPSSATDDSVSEDS